MKFHSAMAAPRVPGALGSGSVFWNWPALESFERTAQDSGGCSGILSSWSWARFYGVSFAGALKLAGGKRLSID
jgi:hypothetical protein